MNSPLATYTNQDTDTYGLRTHAIDTVTVHAFAVQVTGKRGADALTERGYASANYVVGYDGVVSVNVDEDKASMCTSNKANDMRAVTIEVACDSTHPYAVNAVAYNKLIELLADICTRNGIKKLVWSDNKDDRVNHRKGCNMTVHRDYANKACPGDYLYSRMGKIAREVNQIMEGNMNEKRYTSVEDSPKAYQPALKALREAGVLNGYGDDRGIYLTEAEERIIVILKNYIDTAIVKAPSTADVLEELLKLVRGEE